MGMAGSSNESADSVLSSKKASLKHQYLQDLYNAILGGFENPSTTEKIPDLSSLKNSQLEEPSTSTGIKRAADVYANSAAKKARLDSKEEDMTPDSTTPDKYLESGLNSLFSKYKCANFEFPIRSRQSDALTEICQSQCALNEVNGHGEISVRNSKECYIVM
jgi:hypothetical protein